MARCFNPVSHSLTLHRRCHPDIAAVPNAQFYGGRLIDGCTREQRASLLPGLPSLVFLDVRGQEQYSAGTAQHGTAQRRKKRGRWLALVGHTPGAGVRGT